MATTIMVNDQPLEWEPGMTVDDVLKKMRYTFKMLVVKVNDSVVKKDQYSNYQIPEKADVKVIHLMSGG